jgi:mannan polymerase II complex ANP1 subunit
MEQEKLLREQEEKQKAEKVKKMKENFGDTASQWEKDKTEMQNIALQEKKKQGGAAVAAESKEKSDKPVKAQKEEGKKTRKERKEERQPRRGGQQATEDR